MYGQCDPSECVDPILNVCLYHVFCYHAQHAVQKATLTGSALHWLDFKTGDFRQSIAVEVMRETSEKANEFELTASRFLALLR